MRLWELATTRYHKEIGFPAGMPTPSSQFRLHYSVHARQEAARDNVSREMLPNTLPAGFDVVEASALGNVPVKWVVRFALASKPGWDIVLVLNPTYVVSTVWLNRSTDCHRTLKRYLYSEPAA